LDANNLHFLNQFEQNSRFKKCTQGTSPKNSTLQGAVKRKKITGVKNKTRPHHRGYQTYLPKLKMLL
jgi:predicted DNA binding CopG/RHH family protein